MKGTDRYKIKFKYFAVLSGKFHICYEDSISEKGARQKFTRSWGEAYEIEEIVKC